jgi:predicted RNA-binding protein with TRAM domain
MLVGPGAAQLAEIEEVTKRRFFLESSHDAPFDHFNVLDRGPLAKLQPQAAVEEGQEFELKLVEVGLYDPEAGVGKLDGLDVAVAGAAKLVGKKVRVRVERVLNGTAFARLAGTPEQAIAAITAEGLAEKPTRASRSRKAVEPVAEAVEPEPGDDEEPVEAVAEEADAGTAGPKKKRTRRGSRGGRNRRKKPVAAAAEEGAVTVEEPEPVTPKIHLPAADLGTEPNADGANGDEATAATPKKKKTRRGSRGGRRRRKSGSSAASPPPE